MRCSVLHFMINSLFTCLRFLFVFCYVFEMLKCLKLKVCEVFEAQGFPKYGVESKFRICIQVRKFKGLFEVRGSTP